MVVSTICVPNTCVPAGEGFALDELNDALSATTVGGAKGGIAEPGVAPTSKPKVLEPATICAWISMLVYEFK